MRQRLTGCFPFWGIELIVYRLTVFGGDVFFGKTQSSRLHCPCNLVTFACVLPVYYYFMKPRVQWIIQKPLYEVFNVSTNVSSNWRYHQETSGTCGYSMTNQGKTMWDKMFISKVIHVWVIITHKIMLSDVFGVFLRL